MLNMQNGEIITVCLDETEGIRNRKVIHKDSDNIIIYYQSMKNELSLKVCYR